MQRITCEHVDFRFHDVVESKKQVVTIADIHLSTFLE